MATVPTQGILVGGLPQDIGAPYFDTSNETEGIQPFAVWPNGALMVSGVDNPDGVQLGLPGGGTVTGEGVVVGVNDYIALHVYDLSPAGTSGGTPGSTKPGTAVQVAGNDGTDLRVLLTDSSGQLKVLVENSPSVTVSGSVAVTNAGLTSLNTTIVATGASPPADVLMVGGIRDDNGHAIGLLANSSGSLIINTDGAALNTVFANAFGLGSGQPSEAALAGATDGTDTYPLLVDGSGYLKVNVAAGGGGGGSVWGPNASGAAPTEDPVLNAGWDGTDVRTLLTDTSGQLKVLVENSPTVSISGTVPVSGTFYQATQPVSLSSAVTVVGDAANGSAVTGNPVLIAGSDGTDARTLLVSSTGQQHVIVDTAPTTAVTNAGLTALAATIQAVGSAVPADVQMVGASDGTDSRALTVDSSGYLKVNVSAGGAGGGAVYGPTAAGSAPANPPVLLGGQDGAGTPKIRTLGVSVTGAAVPANGVLVGGSDGTDLQAIATDTSGRTKVVGAIASGSGVAGAPVLIGGSDGTDARTLNTDTLGNLSVVNPLSQLLAANTNVTPSSTVSSESGTAGVSGACVAVTVACTLGSTSQNPDNVIVRVRDTTTGIIGPWQSAGLLWGTQSSTLYFNIPVFKGDTVVIDIIAPAGSFTAAKNNFSAVILGEPVPVELRSDGRGLPIGSQVVSIEISASAGGTILAAPAAGFRFLLSSIAMTGAAVTAGTEDFQARATVNGTVTPLLNAASTGTSVSTISPAASLTSPSGILCDPATAITSNATGGSDVTDPWFTVVYDIVPI
jgi:hypothetical protein